MGSLLGGLLLAQVPTTTSISITACSSGCTVQLGRTVAVTATVLKQSNGAAVTSGSVAFYSGANLIGRAAQLLRAGLDFHKAAAGGVELDYSALRGEHQLFVERLVFDSGDCPQ